MAAGRLADVDAVAPATGRGSPAQSDIARENRFGGAVNVAHAQRVRIARSEVHPARRQQRCVVRERRGRGQRIDHRALEVTTTRRGRPLAEQRQMQKLVPVQRVFRFGRSLSPVEERLEKVHGLVTHAAHLSIKLTEAVIEVVVDVHAPHTRQLTRGREQLAQGGESARRPSDREAGAKSVGGAPEIRK